jgi:spore coat polysaccharide biosynthesis predicted glycosyltransferase SpsG
MLSLKKVGKDHLQILKQVRGIYYAFGGGLGHLTRSISIIRKLKKFKNLKLIAITNSPFFIYYEKEKIKYKLFSEKRKIEENVPEFIKNFKPDFIIIDTFSKGILNEVEEILIEKKFKKILVKRFTKESDLEFEIENYDLIIVCENFEYPKIQKVVFTSPILIRDWEEILNWKEAKKIFKISPEKKFVLGVTSSREDRVKNFFNLLLKIKKRLKNFEFELKISSPYKIEGNFKKFIFYYYPLFELIKGVDILIGDGSGYNLFYECLLSKTPAIFIPHIRKFDDQFMRSKNHCRANSPEELENLLIEKLRNNFRERENIYFENGAEKAVSYILSTLG